MEGSSDSVVLERLCAAFEKKEPGAEGRGMRWRRVLSPARELESVFEEACTGGDLSAEVSVWGPACAFIHSCVHPFMCSPIHVSNKCIEQLPYAGRYAI